MEAARTVALPPLQLDVDLRAVVRRTFLQTVTRTVAIRTVGLVVDQLVEAGVQLELWQGDWATGRLDGQQKALDRITTRWGTNGLRRGAITPLVA
jgi:hypothetical protein